MKLSLSLRIFTIVILLSAFGSLVGAQATRCTLCPMGPSGGTGGTEVPLDQNIINNGKVTTVLVRWGNFVDSITFTYSSGNPVKVGGNGGSTERTFALKEGDTIVEMTGNYGTFVDSVRFKTAFGDDSGVMGGQGGPAQFRYIAPPGAEKAGTIGRVGNWVDAIGAVLRSPAKPRS